MAENPLQQQDLDNINQRLAELDAADETINRAMNAGIDMSAQKQRSSEARQRLLKLKQAFFPGQ